MADPDESGNQVKDRKTNDKSIYINNALAEKDPSEYLRTDSFNNKDFFKDARSVSSNINIDNDNKNYFTQESDSRRYIRNRKGHFVKSRKDPKYYVRHGSQSYGRLFNNSLKMGRRQVGDMANVQPAADAPNDEENMRMKLFRLMYETVRDSDLKVKRAELIKTHYHNSSAFDIGYLMGDMTDKYNIMQDIATTLERLYHEWKPLEHINAYEQIANQAIQISHLIDMMRHINKRNSTM
ncbi:uncharacterized protein LOC115455222 isoform X2 [Manduca sexta]|nr:uncharacterized protein LOC115455222 isoform X2 [Manduca sexta]